jgi:hypothetical protein
MRECQEGAPPNGRAKTTRLAVPLPTRRLAKRTERTSLLARATYRYQTGEGILQKKSLTHDEVLKCIFYESVENAKTAKKSGRTGVRHSPMMIRFYLSLNHAVGSRAWDTIASVWHLPTRCTLDAYKTIGSTAPDGFCFKTAKLTQCLEQRKESPSG